MDTSISRPQCIAPRQRRRPENIGAPAALEPKEPADSRLAQRTPVRRQVVEDRTVRTIVAIAFDDQTRREQAAPGVPLELAMSALGLTGVTAVYGVLRLCHGLERTMCRDRQLGLPRRRWLSSRQLSIR